MSDPASTHNVKYQSENLLRDFVSRDKLRGRSKINSSTDGEDGGGREASRDALLGVYAMGIDRELGVEFLD